LTSLAAWDLPGHVAGVLVWVMIALAVFVGSWLLAKLVSDLIRRALSQRSVHTRMAVLAARVVYVGLITIGAFVAVALAFQSANLAIAGVLAATVLASLGVQDLLRNYVSGFYLLLERNLMPGDRIDFDGRSGVVTEIRLRVTLLRGDDGSLVVVPNAELFNKAVSVQRPPPEAPAPARPTRRRRV
jgi:small-conductance mechanosensitive channel